MRAIQCVEWGDPDKLVLADLPLPQPKPSELRIRVGAAGVNFPDGLIIQRKYQVQPELPFIPGTEVAGRVDLVGGSWRSSAWADSPRRSACRPARW
jgi:NADPH2:quinone reductase